MLNRDAVAEKPRPLTKACSGDVLVPYDVTLERTVHPEEYFRTALVRKDCTGEPQTSVEPPHSILRMRRVKV